VEPLPRNASEQLQEIIRRNRRSEKVGVYAVCSAHPSVIAAAVQQAGVRMQVLIIDVRWSIGTGRGRTETKGRIWTHLRRFALARWDALSREKSATITVR